MDCKVLFISPSFYPAMYYGGPIISSYELAKALNKAAIDIKVITTNANGPEKLNFETGVFQKLDNGLPIKYYRAFDSRGTSISMILNLWLEIKKADIVYLISVFSPPTPLSIIFCRILKKQLIISPKGQIDKWCLEQGSSFKKLWLKIFIKPFINYLYWHATSDEEKGYIQQVFPNANIFILKHIINMLEYAYKKEKSKTIFNNYTGFDCSNKKIIISMGRIHRKKGFDILIKAIEILLKENQNYLLFIGGTDFGERTELQSILTRKHLLDKVYFVGHIEGEEKVNFLHNADVFALPSHDENFGLVYAEALAVGTPVVASIGTPWQDVIKYYCGKWVENTPEKFADSINQILDSDTEQMGENGRKYIEENFSSEKITELFIKQLKLIMNERNANK